MSRSLAAANRPLEAGALERALRRLARAVLAHRKAVLVGSLLFLCAAGLFGAGLPKHVSQGGFDSATEESVRATAVLEHQFHAGPSNFVVLVTVRSGTVDSPAAVAAGQQLTARLAGAAHMGNVMSYWTLQALPVLRTADRSQALIVGRILGDQNQVVEREPDVVRALGHAPTGVRIQVGGFGPAFHEVNKTVEHDVLLAEAVAIPLTMVVLFFVFGSAVAAAMPLTIGGIAVVGTLATLRLLTTFTPVSVFAVNLTTALGLGLAIDYSLFMVSRFREELAHGHDVDTAIETTMATAGRTVAGSALTVSASLAALLVFPLMFLRSFAYAGIAVSLLAGLGAMVVLPAVLALLGPRINALTVWKGSVQPPAEGFWSRTATLVMRRPVVVMVSVVAVLLLLGAPFLSLKLGYLDDRVLAPSDRVVQVNNTLRAEFGSGQNGAIDVVAPAVSPSARAQIAPYAAVLSKLAGVARVDAGPGVYIRGVRLPAPGAYLAQFQGASGTWFSVVPSVNPSSLAAKNLVAAIRSGPKPFAVLVGGMPASYVDSIAVITGRLPLALALIAVISFSLLFLLFRSLLIPIKALVLNVLSLSATFGAMVWIFQEGHFSRLLDFTPTGALIATMPILMFCVAFGLSMDYEVFLISRMKEHHDAGDHNVTAVVRGLQQTGRIITAAAVVMSIVMLALVSSHISFIKTFGLGLTLAVLMDAFVIRGLLVPAVMRLFGEANWWAPRWSRPKLTPLERYPIYRPDLPSQPLVGADR